MSKEHVLAQWLRSKAERDANATHVFGAVSGKLGIGMAPLVHEKRRNGHVGTRKVRVVCQSCNNGWMSQLEKLAKPVISPLMEGRNCLLTPFQQRQLATWVCKTAMTAEYVSPKPSRIPSGDRSYLKSKLLPPNNWLIWAARHDVREWSSMTMYQSRGSVKTFLLTDMHVAPSYIQSTTFGVGAVLFLAISTDVPLVASRFKQALGENWKGLTRIWPQPGRILTWPPRSTLNRGQVNAVANILTVAPVLNNRLNPLAGWNFAM